MPGTLSKSTRSYQRREMFREYMRKLNPTAPARVAIESGLILEALHGSLYRTLAARADLDRASQQLLIGGIGSGKTTELLMAERWLRHQGQTLPLYIDISAETDLSGLNSGALLAGFGLHLARAFSDSSVKKSLPDEEQKPFENWQREIKDFAFGKTKSYWVPDEPEWEPDFDEPGGHYVVQQIPGKLKPPFPALRRDIQAIHAPLEGFIKALQAHSFDVVAIFDGLDRLITPDKFWAVVHQDFRALRLMGVSVLAAAPLSVLYGTGRSISEHFDRVHHMPTLRADADLRSVLTHRGASELLGPDDVELVCAGSGGVLRDVVALARDAGEAAYVDGGDRILPDHVKAAIKQLGEAYLRGLGPEQIRVLRRLSKDQSFDVASDANIELMVTRRVLEYSAIDFRIHPALKPLLPKSEKQNA